ncbi:hypothetical protein EIP86_004507 [Pleurotus ostreatoroseus]|nr:hypothetical protein EIP86_004507 [Pleurotus ostreatoroseus]
MPEKAAFVTLLTKTEYLPGTLVLHASLVDAGSKYPFVVMVTPAVCERDRQIMARRGIKLRDIESLRPEEGKHTLDDHDERFRDVWTKLRCASRTLAAWGDVTVLTEWTCRAFELVEYDRIVLVDSDMLIMRNMDELMDLELPQEWIAAAHVCACNPRKLPHYPEDWIPENCAHSSVSHPNALSNPPQITPTSPRPYTQLNSGTVVLRPSLSLAHGIYTYLRESPLVPTFQFADQDLLAHYFAGRWTVLPWCYNALKTLRRVHTALWRDEEVRCVHYILPDKPWNTPRGTAGEDEEVNRWWWDRYEKLKDDMRRTDPEGLRIVDANVAHVM